MRFQWDPAKDVTNRFKHDGISFGIAVQVFNDPNLLLSKERVVDGEQRWHAIGVIDATVLLVVHVCREERESGEEVIRIVSARQASKRERRNYFEQAFE